ncbi:glucose dehydrogenase [FAD, quinone] [Rhipicephalus sanguineus]|uniref:glucose dehydrogenase [FAD, quinone] n=1 Tax=Rhipicephalus sanguineus TaxID=34632 RepID=UPI0020C42BB1|nr:glucose dehydrogenase [FAD, quinone] [Rhipicephalus sanguineus]
MTCALWGRGAAPQNLIGLLLAMVNLLVHVPFTDLPSLRDYELGTLKQEYDYIIVGGGSAGSVIANRLSANPDVTVLLLEAGGLETASRQIPVMAAYNVGGHDDWAYWTVPQKNACLSFREQRCPLPRGKVLGGTSVLNYMLYVRGDRLDYDRWAQKYGAKGWAYEDVLPHFKDIEDYRVGPLGEYHGAGGEVPVDYANTSTPLSDVYLEACSQSGYGYVDYNGPSQFGCSRPQTNMKNGERFSASKAFIDSVIRARKNLDVALISQVTKVNFEGSRAVGVTFTRFGQSRNVSAGREVILSAGTIGSAQILLLSGVGPRKDLERLKIPVVSDLPVGRSIQDHVLFFTAVPVITDQQAGIPLFSLEDIAQYEQNRTDTELCIADAQAYDSYLAPRDNVPGFRLAVINVRPESRGRITLRSTDPNEQPDIDLRLMEHPQDVRVAAEGTKIFIDQILNTDAMRGIGAKPWDVTFPPCAEAGPQWSMEYIECLFRHLANPGWHICCSAPMGSHPNAVVDERLRVRGNITGLRVADASVMPDIVSGTTQAAAMMIGSKAAAMIIEDSGSDVKKTVR